MKIELPRDWKYVAGITEVSEGKAPAASCPRCGGWMGSSGMDQHSKSKKPMLGRKGCICNSGATPAQIKAAKAENNKVGVK